MNTDLRWLLETNNLSGLHHHINLTVIMNKMINIKIIMKLVETWVFYETHEAAIKTVGN